MDCSERETWKLRLPTIVEELNEDQMKITVELREANPYFFYDKELREFSIRPLNFPVNIDY